MFILKKVCITYLRSHLTTPSPKGSKNLNLKIKFKILFWPLAKGWSFFTSSVFVTLEGTCLLWRLSRVICHFLGTMTEMGPIQKGVQNWLQSSHESKWWCPPWWGSFVVTLFNQELFPHIQSFACVFKKMFKTKLNQYIISSPLQENSINYVLFREWKSSGQGQIIGMDWRLDSEGCKRCY